VARIRSGAARAVLASLLGLAGLLPLGARALEARDPAALAATYFERLYGFNSLEAYEARRGPAHTTFSIARRWSHGRADVLVDIASPQAFSKWGFLLHHQTDRVDDLFVYLPDFRRVRRFSAPQLLREIPFKVFPIGELRPLTRDEFAYALLGEAELAGEACVVVEARPLHSGLAFDRLVLAISTVSGFALESRTFSADRELRRVRISPGDVRDVGGRMFPIRRSIRTPTSEDETELVLRNVMLDPELPARLFRKRTLLQQRFPEF
jgi:hypothetical protein